MLFPDKAKRYDDLCCTGCGKPIKDSDFKDLISRKEYSISGLCQFCQDEAFGGN